MTYQIRIEYSRNGVSWFMNEPILYRRKKDAEWAKKVFYKNRAQRVQVVKTK